MSSAHQTISVGDDEQLARFVLFRNRIRTSDKTVKPDLFIPHPHSDLSVTRHKDISERELWRIGSEIAEGLPATLYGRADIRASEVRRHALEIRAAPVQGNPNHANVIGWPAERSAQKSIAQQLAAACKFVSNPSRAL